MAVVLRIARDAYRVNDVCSTTLFLYLYDGG